MADTMADCGGTQQTKAQLDVLWAAIEGEILARAIHATGSILGPGNDVDVIRRTVQSNPSLLDEKGPDEMTALLYAVMLHKVNALQTLLELGAEPNSTRNWECLHWAVLDSNIDIIQVLLESGANPDTSDAENANVTPLTRAATHNDTTAMKLLLAAGCDVNKPGVFGTTALTIVIDRFTHCCDESVSLLLSYGADPTIANTKFNSSMSSSIEVAAKKNSFPSENIFKQLFSVAEEKWKSKADRILQMKGAISRAIMAGIAGRVLWLLQRFDVEPEELIPTYASLLTDACTYGDYMMIVNALLGKSGSPFRAVTDGVLAAAIEGDRRACMREFLHAGVNLYVVISDRFTICTPLMFAIEKSRGVIAVGLIQAGCDIWSGVNERQTVFPVRGVFGEAEAAAIFAKSRSPIAYAATREMEPLVRALCSAGANTCDVIKDMDAGVLRFPRQMDSVLRQLAKSPLSLKESCRLSIRRYTRQPLIIFVDHLPLPRQMVDYLLFRDLPECLV